MSTANSQTTDDQATMPFLDHLEELRGTLIKSALAWVIGMILVVPFFKYMRSFFMIPFLKAGHVPDDLVMLEMLSPFSIIMKIIMWAGLIIALPFIIYQIMKFIFPGLLEKEKFAVKVSSFFSVLLFFCGVAICYFVTLPYAIKIMDTLSTFLSGAETPRTEILYKDYVGFVLKLLMAFGLSFQLPIITFGLGYLGVITSTQMREKRKHVFVGLLVLAMFLTPPDMFSQIVMAVPLYIMYEICIWLIRIKEKNDPDFNSDPDGPGDRDGSDGNDGSSGGAKAATA